MLRKTEKREMKSRTSRKAEAVGSAERADENSSNTKVHFFSEFIRIGASRNTKVASNEKNTLVKYGIRFCDTK